MKKALILLSTYNGEKYLKDLLHSLRFQDSKNTEISILVRDDGSSDSTIDILTEYQSLMKLHYYIGKNLGPSGSFINLVNNAPLDYDFYFFCDQDDVWKKDKIISSIECISLDKSTIPILYYCSLDIVDANLNKTGVYFRNTKYFSSLKLTLMTGVVIPGCTMAFNNCLMQIAKTYIPIKVNMHDHWIVLVCLLFNGKVIGDKKSLILYRQHGKNVVGIKKLNLLKRIKRFLSKKNVFSNNYKELLKFPLSSKRENTEIVNIFANYQSNFSYKLKLLKLKSKELSFKEIILFKIKIFFNLL